MVTNVGEADKQKTALMKGVSGDKALTLIFIADKKPTKEYAFLFKEPATAEEFALPEGRALAAFIETEAKARGAKLSAVDARSLAASSGSDTWTIVTELDKLALGGALETNARPPFFPLLQQLKNRYSLASRLSALAYLLEYEDLAATFNITASLMEPELKPKMADYDVAIKSGKLEYEEVLTDLALRA